MKGKAVVLKERAEGWGGTRCSYSGSAKAGELLVTSSPDYRGKVGKDR